MVGGRRANMVMNKGIYLVSVAEVVYQSHLACRGLGGRKKETIICPGEVFRLGSGNTYLDWPVRFML